MRLLDLVEHQDRVWCTGSGGGEQPALIEADAPGRRADEARDGVRLHVLRHIEADELDAEGERELPGKLGLANAGRSGEEERADRLLGLPKAGARDLDGVDDLIDGVILAVDDALQISVETLKPFFLRYSHRPRRNLGHTGNDVLDVVDADRNGR